MFQRDFKTRRHYRRPLFVETKIPRDPSVRDGVSTRGEMQRNKEAKDPRSAAPLAVIPKN